MDSSFSWQTQVGPKLKAEMKTRYMFLFYPLGSSIPLVIVSVDKNLFG